MNSQHHTAGRCQAIFGIITAAILFSGSPVVGQFDPQFKIGDTVAVDIQSVHPYPAAAQDGIAWSQTIVEPGATFLRAHFTDASALAEGDMLRIRDGQGQLVREYNASEVYERWTPSVNGDTLTLEIWSVAGSSAFGIIVDELAVGTYPLHPENNVAGENVFFTICNTSVPSRIRTADPVTRLTWVDDCGGVFLCTGWLFSELGHMMTNAHCANSQTEANNLECWFNYMLTSCDLNFPNPDVYDDAITFVTKDCDRDFAVHKVFDPTKGNPADRYGHLTINPTVPANGTELWLPQHPGGIRKQIAENCTVLDSTEAGFNGCGDPPNGCNNQGFPVAVYDLSFDCDIEGGSSGSPVLNTNDEVVAIAHAGNGIENFGVRMFNIVPLLPNYPTSLQVNGLASVNEAESIQFTAVAFYLNGTNHAVTNFVDWTIVPQSAGTITQSGLFTANNVVVNTPVTIAATYEEDEVIVHGQLGITVVNTGVDTPIITVNLVPSVNPTKLTPGQEFHVDVIMNTDGDAIPNVRLVQLDVAESTGVTVDSIDWGAANPIFSPSNSTLYQFFSNNGVFSAFWPLSSPIPGFILNLGSLQTPIARIHLTFNQNGTLSILGPATPATIDEGVRLLSGFDFIDEYSLVFTNVVGGTLALSAGTGTNGIVSSLPPNNAIDAAQPSNVDGTNPIGWSSIDLVFSDFIEGITTDDFDITQEGGVLAPPTITGLLPLGEFGVRAFFNSRIEPGARTTITHVPSQTLVRLGYLPADVNADGTSSPVDILALIDTLNGIGPPRPSWSTDINRSGLTEPSDILRVIDLLNGAGAFVVWNGVSLP